jgi:hypothetical protein
MPGSTLWVLSLDTESEELFRKLNKAGIRTVSLSDLNNPALLDTRTKRTKQEFAWTCKPAFMSYLIEVKKPETLVFVDSDLLFYAPIDSLFVDHPQASVMLTSHKFTKEKEHLADLVGYFNSGFIVFRNTDTTRAALTQYKNQCIEWCYNYHDKGRHGDQSYLKTWPQEFKNIEEIPEKGVNLGTWNISRYNIKKEKDGYTIDEEKLICYHFHGFIAYIKSGTIKPYPITIHHAEIYKGYRDALQIAQDEISKLDATWIYGFAQKLSLLRIIKQELTRIARTLWR